MRWITRGGLCLLALGCGSPEPAKSVDSDTDPGSTPDSRDVVDTADTAPGETDVLDTGLSYPWPSSPLTYSFERGTFLHDIEIPAASGAGACCRDWGPVSRNPGTDNALAAMNAFAKIAQLDLNVELAAVIRGGDFVPVLDHRGVPVGDGDYKLGFFLAEWTPTTTYTKASQGLGEFYVSPDSFRPGTGKPEVVFRRATKTGNAMHAEGGNFEIALVIQNVNLRLPVRDVTIDANLIPDSLGLAISDGELSGYVVVDELFEAYNDLVTSSCGCAVELLGDEPLFSKSTGSWVGQCKPHASTEGDPDATPPVPPVVGVAEVCDELSERVCENLIGDRVTLGGVCGLIGSAVPDVADLDLDSDGEREALSVGLRANGVPATILGLTPEAP